MSHVMFLCMSFVCVCSALSFDDLARQPVREERARAGIALILRTEADIEGENGT